MVSLVQALEIVVVLGCRVETAGTLSAAAERRVARAAAAFHEGTCSRLLISGGRLWGELSEATAFARALEQRGVPAHAIELETRSLTTRDNARYSAAWLRERGLSTPGLVTCDWHMRRALAHFREFGLTAIPLPAPSPEQSALRTKLRAIREQASFVWARMLPAPLHELARFFR